MSCDRPPRHADWPGTGPDGCRPKYAQIGDGPLMAVYWEYEESTVLCCTVLFCVGGAVCILGQGMVEYISPSVDL